MPAKSEDASKYSKIADVEEDPNDFDDIITKQTAFLFCLVGYPIKDDSWYI